MSLYDDDDGIDAPWEKAMAALPCDACGRDVTTRTEFTAGTNGRTIMLCRWCSREAKRVQANLEASRRLIGIK